MDGYTVKLEYIAPAMNDMIEKLQNFETVSTNEKKNLIIRSILTTVEDLRNCLKRSVVAQNVKSQQSFISHVERIFSEFNWDVNYSIKPYEFQKFIACCKNLTTSVIRFLGKKNCAILVVNLYFNMCIKVISQLSENVEEHANVLKDLLLFQTLAKGFLSSTKVLKRFWYVIIPMEQKCSIMLCLNQSFKTLCFLGKIIDKRLTHLIIYLLNRLKECFNKILTLLGEPDQKSQNSEFIILMDSCINKLDQFGYEMSLQEGSNVEIEQSVMALKPLIDELLCHAMTVCHISDRENDCNLIKLHSQKVLDEFEILSDTKDRSELSEIADRLSHLLCQLEEAVNNSILNVVLDVFTDINDPLKNLMNKCNTDKCLNKSVSDLENEVADFDEHMDRIMHIGLFAISCSTDVRKILEIRSCLASLESLEAELITSIISMYIHSNPETKATFQYIFKNWMEEMNELKVLMDHILDPAAFCQVVEKRITALAYAIKEDEPVSNIRHSLNKILSFAKKLMKTLMRSVEHEEENVKKMMKEHIESLQLAFQECEASQLLFDQDIPMKELCQRITKRVTLVITSIKSISKNLTDRSNYSEESGTCIQSKFDDMEEKLDIYKLNAITPEVNTPINMEVLTPYINKGMIKKKERTILYNTPRKIQTFQDTPVKFAEIKSWGQSFRPRSRTRCCRPLPRDLELENSLDLELTELLDNMSDLSSTFKTFQDSADEDLKEVTVPVTVSDANTNGNVLLGTIMRQKLEQSLQELSNSSTLSIHKDSNCKYETPERMHDLTLVQRKINFLMEHMND